MELIWQAWSHPRPCRGPPAVRGVSAALGGLRTDRLFSAAARFGRPRSTASSASARRCRADRALRLPQDPYGHEPPAYFEDPGFAAAIRAASVRLFAACAGDLAIHSAAVVGSDGRLDADERRRWRATASTRRCGMPSPPRTPRCRRAPARPSRPGRRHGLGRGRFRRGGIRRQRRRLVRVAPVIDEFKALDRPIVRNSMRFRWRDVRARAAATARSGGGLRRLAGRDGRDAARRRCAAGNSPVVPVAQCGYLGESGR